MELARYLVIPNTIYTQQDNCQKRTIIPHAFHHHLSEMHFSKHLVADQLCPLTNTQVFPSLPNECSCVLQVLLSLLKLKYEVQQKNR